MNDVVEMQPVVVADAHRVVASHEGGLRTLLFGHAPDGDSEAVGREAFAAVTEDGGVLLAVGIIEISKLQGVAYLTVAVNPARRSPALLAKIALTSASMARSRSCHELHLTSSSTDKAALELVQDLGLRTVSLLTFGDAAELVLSLD